MYKNQLHFYILEKKLMETEFLKILLTIATKYLKYLGVSITRYVQDLKSTKHCRYSIKQLNKLEKVHIIRSMLSDYYYD